MRQNRLRPYVLPAAVLAAGFGLRLWFILRHAVVQNDSNLYAEIASNWFHHGVYGFSTDTVPRPTLIRLPGYPAFLIVCTSLLGWLFGAESFTSTLLIQLLLDLASCVLLALVARSIALRSGQTTTVARRVAMVTLSASALCPFTANYVATPLTECPTIFTIALALFAMDGYVSACERSTAARAPLILLGMALAWSLTLRPDQLVFLFAIVFAMLWTPKISPPPTIPLSKPSIVPDALESRLRLRMHARKLKPARSNSIAAMIVLGLAVLPLVPWTVRNHRAFHLIQPLAPKSATDPGETVPSGFQRWYRTWAVDFASTEEFYWKYPEDPMDAGLLPNRAFNSDAQFDQTVELIADSNEADHYDAAIDERFARLAQQRVAADPIGYYIVMPVGRVMNMLFHPRNEMWATDLRWWQFRRHPAQTVWAIIAAIASAAYFMAGAWGMYRARKHFPGACGSVVLAALLYFVLRCAVLFMLDNAEQRYTVEFFPFAEVGTGLLLLRKRAPETN